MRTVEEWIGSSDDAKVPDRVKLRIWQRCEGRCYLTGKKLRPGDSHDYDHIVALCNGGENRESNIAVISRAKHIEKTAADRSIKKKTDRMAKKHIGAWPKSRGFSPHLTKKFDGTVVPRKAGR